MKQVKYAARTLVCLLAATAICKLLSAFAGDGTYACMIFLLITALTAKITEGYVWGIAAGVVGTILANWAFSEPYFQIDLTTAGFPLTFMTQLGTALLLAMLTTQVKEQAKISSAAAHQKLRSDLLRALSHDMRTPLTSISGSARVWLEAHERLSAEKQEQLVNDIAKDADKLSRTFENILALTRMESGTDAAKKRPEAAEEVVGEAVIEFRRSHPEISVHTSLPEELMMIPMDAFLVEQVIKNIMENSAEHGGCVTEIGIALKHENNKAVFTLSDNGNGIDESIFPQLFEPFAKKGAADDGNNNMGIGLALCRSAVMLHGGSIKGFNNERGAVIEFTLPM